MTDPEKHKKQPALFSDENEVEDPTLAEDDESPTGLRYTVSSYGADYPVDGLVKRLENEDIEIPKFQRKFVWTSGQCSRFIESLLLGLPVPGIFLSKEHQTNKLLVIDGQQRLQTLKAFYSGLLRDAKFELRGVTKELEGLTYKTLGRDDKRRLDDAIIHATIVRQESPGGDGSIYLVFERLNTGGTPLSPQEIRACVYRGEFNKLLGELNDSKSWRNLFGAPSKRLKDQEMILRFLALYFAAEDYERPMELFLSMFMDKNREFAKHAKDQIDRVFRSTMELAGAELPKAAFRPKGNLNAAYTEAILVGTARRLAIGDITDKHGYKGAADKLLQNEEFKAACEKSTSDEKQVENRLRLAAEAFAAVK